MRIPLPHKGQPLDITFLYTLADAVNKLADDIAVDKFTSFGYNGTVQTTASKLGLDAGRLSVSKTGAPTVITASFATQFAEPPVVTATLGSSAGAAAYKNKLSISNITSTNVQFSIEFDANIGVSDVHWHAVGISR